MAAATRKGLFLRLGAEQAGLCDSASAETVADMAQVQTLVSQAGSEHPGARCGVSREQNLDAVTLGSAKIKRKPATT